MIKRKALFYTIITGLAILDGFLLSKPNLLGKIGLFIFKFHYLRTFPRALLTVSIVIIISILLAEVIRSLVNRRILRRTTGLIVLIFLIAVAAGALVETAIDFSTWAVSHTGRRFKYGAYLLPLMLVAIFVHGVVKLPKPLEQTGLPLTDEVKNNLSTDADGKS